MVNHFGPVQVASKKLVASGKLYTVTLQQLEAHSSYTQEDVLAGHTTKSPPATFRRVKVRISLEEAEPLTEGAIVPGHIMRTIHNSPQHKGQKEAYTGGYPQAAWVPAYIDDVDLRASS